MDKSPAACEPLANHIVPSKSEGRQRLAEKSSSKRTTSQSGGLQGGAAIGQEIQLGEVLNFDKTQNVELTSHIWDNHAQQPHNSHPVALLLFRNSTSHEVQHCTASRHMAKCRILIQPLQDRCTHCDEPAVIFKIPAMAIRIDGHGNGCCNYVAIVAWLQRWLLQRCKASCFTISFTHPLQIQRIHWNKPAGIFTLHSTRRPLRDSSSTPRQPFRLTNRARDAAMIAMVLCITMAS